ncbi:MAG: T9SS type B sorting domain-containing protein, partial [Flavobacteriaceae bacterium]
ASSDTDAIKQALIGALITSEDNLGGTNPKPVVVVTGSVGGNLRNGSNPGNSDYGLDQITDIELLGSEYIFIKGGAAEEIEKVILIADEDGTSIFKDGVDTGIILNEGEHLIYQGADYTNGANMYISTFNPTVAPTTVPKKLVAYQGIGYGSSSGGDPRANQGLVYVPPLSCASRGNIDNIPFINRIGSNIMLGGTLTILTEDGAVLEIFRQEPGQPSVLIADNQGTSGVYDLSGNEKTVDGNSKYKTYFLLSQPSLKLEDNIAVKSDKELYLASSTYSDFGSGGSFYSGFVTDPQVEPDLTISPLGVCISSSGVSNVELKTSNSFDTYKWEKYDFLTNTWNDAPTDPSDPLSTNNQAKYKPIEEGDYRVVGTLSCYPLKQYESDTQIVSICPTDFDGDGIVDNIDLDLDNDGILNSIESTGNGKIDLNSISSPVLMFPTFSFPTSATYTPATSSTFTGDSDGNFKSEIVSSGLNETATYNFNPVQYDSSFTPSERRVNILFSEDSSVTHTYNADEVFSIRAITDVNDKNFTVIDPGEKLLVNNGSGFVTIPPEGYSGRKIIFKYNDDPFDPSLEFSFYAYDIEGFEFTHSISSVASANSSFSGKFEILDYILDSDSDGDLDMYDYDSDGDGCNDIIEGDINFSNVTIRPRVDLDPNNDGIYGDLTYGSSGDQVIQDPDVDSRGRINDLIDVTSGTYIDPPLDPITSIPVYLETNAPSVIFSAGGQPEDYQVCEIGQDAEFKVTVDSGGYTPFYQWQVDIQDGNGWKNLLDSSTTPLTIDATLEIKSVTAAMDGWEYRVLTWSDGAFCYSISDPAVLKVEATLPTAKAVTLADIPEENWIIKCDDGLNKYDGIATFDLTLIDDYIRGPLQSSTDFEVSYFLNATDAASPTTTGITNPSTFTWIPVGYNPTSPTVETLEIHVRVRNVNSNCLADPTSFELTTNPIPLLKPNTDPRYSPTEYPFIQCNDGIFNLTTKEKGISSNYANEEFEYYDSSGNRITDPTNYEIPALVNRGLNEIINVTIKTKPSLGTACVNTSATINLEWALTLLPAGYTLKDEYLVETDPDPKGQGQDGIETFDKTIFATVQAGLIAAETRFSGKTFSFYRSENDALTSFNKIDTTVDFTTDEQTNAGFTFNTAENRWEQQIWVYVEDSVTSAISTCYGLYHIATVYVEKRPVFYDVTMQELCDEQTPLDMYSEFSTTSLFSEFTTDPTGTVTQDTSLFTVEYTYVDDTGAPKTGPTLPSNFNTKDQTITVTLTNNSTNTTPPAGVSSGTIEFKVYQQPVAYPSDPSVPGVYTFVECDDDNDGLAVGEEVFDMSSITTRLLTDISGTAAQDPNDFDFEYSVAGTTITLGSDYTARTGDQIEVKITNPLYPVCEETITIDFVVNPLPSFDIDDTTVICLNLTQPVEIGTSNWNGAADHSIYTYSWTLDSDPSFSEATETIFPVKGGIYTVVVEDPITFCTQTKSITVTESNIASIDLDDDGDVTDTEYDHFIEVLDLTDDNTNTIKINNVADLGIGDYEFSLDNFNYQDDNEFTDLDPGVYTLYIRDKNSYYGYTYGCGILEVTVSVIGYKKYFTPNNDGINDKWKILGIRIDFNNASEIYIFDRYGKLLKQLDPITDGWDGTYLGKPMPATDYWFRVYLEDGREFKGHFSLIRGKY